MAKNEAKIKFTAETGEFNSAIKKSNDEMSELRAEMRLNDAQMKDTGASVEALENKHKILSNQLAVAEDKTAALSQKLNSAVKYFGENSTEASKLRIQLLNAQTAEEQLRQAVKECSDALDEQKNFTEEVNEKFSKMGEVMGDVAVGGIAAVTAAIGAAGTVAITTANDIDKATNDFVAKTGESAESAEEFEDVMTNIYNNNFGESFEDIAESMATVKTAMGDLGSDELEKLTTDALILRDTFDMDVNESIRAVNSMMDQFGISADEAFNLIAQGAQNGLNQNGDLLDVVNEYSVQFQNAGYSAEDMFNMLANGVESGTWSVDKLGDAVKEFNIRMSDGSAKDAVEALGFSWEGVSAAWSAGGAEAQEVFNMLFNELDGLENTTEGYGIGVGLLGTMYEDLGQDAILALSNTNGAISSTKDALGEINAVKYDDLGSAIEGIKRNLQTSVAEPIQNEVMPAINEFVQDIDWQGVGQTIGEVMGTVVDAFFALVDGISQAVQWAREHQGVMTAVAIAIGVVVTAVGLFSAGLAISNAMTAAGATSIWGLVAAHWAQATAGMAAIAPYVLIVAAIAAVIAIIVLCVKHWDEIVAAVKNAWENIKAVLAVWGEWINTNVIQPIVNFFKGLWQSLQTIWNTICNVVQVAIMFIGSIISAAVNIITLPFQLIWENCKQYVFAAWEWIKNAISTAINAVKNVVTTVMNAISNVISTVWNSIKSAVSTAVNAVKTVVSSVWNGIKSTTSSIWEGIKNVISNVWNNIKSNVSNVVNGVKNTVSNVFNGIKSTATTVWNNIKSAIITPIEAARDKVKGVVDAIKGFFSGLKLSLPKIKLPHFKITGKLSLNPPSVPKLSIEWYKDGGILTRPTIFGMNGTNFMAGGEAGAEAILPIDRLEGYIAGAIEKHMSVVNLDALAMAIEDLANRPIEMSINGRRFATATASAGDSINGVRSLLKSRGLMVE